MTAKEYLRQAYRLDQRIASDIAEARDIRQVAGSVSAVQYQAERVQTSSSTDAPFVRALDRLWKLEEKIESEIELMSALKKQIREVIEAVPDTDERLVLKYRYIHDMTWEEIEDEMNAGRSTIIRWHGNALSHVVLPENPIRI